MEELKSNGLENIISQAIAEMRSEQGNNFSLEKINLAELERRTGVSRARLRDLKQITSTRSHTALWGRNSRALFSAATLLIWINCFAMDCHHCGQRYVEFFPNAKQENLFTGMIHAFGYMGIPKYILTDNMKSVVLHRDFEGHPVWQKDYEAFMKTVGFQTRLFKPRHPFTKGKVERAGSVCERKLPCWKSLLEHYGSEPSSAGLVKPAKQHLPQCYRRCTAGNALQTVFCPSWGKKL